MVGMRATLYCGVNVLGVRRSPYSNLGKTWLQKLYDLHLSSHRFVVKKLFQSSPEGLILYNQTDVVLSLQEIQKNCNLHVRVQASMSWASLPDDIVEEILAKLSLLELARISRTCSSFNALYDRRLEGEPKARHDLANKAFGHERIARIGALAACFLKGEPLGLPLVEGGTGRFSMSVDGAVVHLGRGSGPRAKAGESIVSVSDYDWLCPRRVRQMFTVDVYAENGSIVYMVMHNNKLEATINLSPSSDDDLEGVALVQALLSGGLAQSISDAGVLFTINIWPSHLNEELCTPSGLRAQRLPLLGYASGFKSVTKVPKRPKPLPSQGQYTYREYMQIGEMESAAQ